MQMRAISAREPGRLVQTLTGAILGCGGWVLSRGATDTGLVNMLFEFERHSCIDIYSVLLHRASSSARRGTFVSPNYVNAREWAHQECYGRDCEH